MTSKLFHRDLEKIHVDTIIDEGTLNKNNVDFKIINLKGHTLASVGILTKDNVFVVPLKKGLRFAVCAVSEEKCAIAPSIIKNALNHVLAKG